MQEFQITEHIAWDKRVEFSISSFREMAEYLRHFMAIKKLHRGKKYRVLIEEI